MFYPTFIFPTFVC